MVAFNNAGIKTTPNTRGSSNHLKTSKMDRLVGQILRIPF